MYVYINIKEDNNKEPSIEFPKEKNRKYKNLLTSIATTSTCSLAFVGINSYSQAFEVLDMLHSSS